MPLTPEQKETGRGLLAKGFQKSLEEHKVPLRTHLKVVKALADSMKAHKADMEVSNLLLERKDSMTTELNRTLSQERQAHQDQLSAYDGHLQRLANIDWSGTPGEKGEDGANGIAPTVEEVVEAVLPHLPQAEKGKDGKNAEFDKDAFKKEMLSYIKAQKFDLSNVRGATDFIMQTSQKNVRIKFEEMLHGAGKATSGGFSVIAVTGTINDSNVTFTATSQPTLLNINGAFYQKTGGAITWTYSGGAITLSSAVGTGGNIYGIA